MTLQFVLISQGNLLMKEMEIMKLMHSIYRCARISFEANDCLFGFTRFKLHAKREKLNPERESHTQNADREKLNAKHGTPKAKLNAKRRSGKPNVERETPNACPRPIAHYSCPLPIVH
jgi:hypothetical protein